MVLVVLLLAQNFMCVRLHVILTVSSRSSAQADGIAPRNATHNYVEARRQLVGCRVNDWSNRGLWR